MTNDNVLPARFNVRINLTTGRIKVNPSRGISDLEFELLAIGADTVNIGGKGGKWVYEKVTDLAELQRGKLVRKMEYYRNQSYE